MTGVTLQVTSIADSVPFWGARTSVPIDTPLDQLRKGEYLWMSDAVSVGPLVMVIGLPEQRAYLYRNGILIAATTVSTGRPGYRTPSGVFTILQKQKEHRSSLYDDAPMPYMERLTWDGIALHAGGLPGRPESHGCIHLPSEFARRLFDLSTNGMTVVIGAQEKAPRQVAHPGFLAPVNSSGGPAAESPPFAATEDERWQPELSPDGPVSIVLSQGSRRVVVYRNGVEIGRARLSVSGDAPLGNHALVLAAGPSDVANPYVPDPAKFRWLRIDVPGHMGEGGTQMDPVAVARLRIPAGFVARVNAILTPGATVLVTHERLTPQTTGRVVEVVDADPPTR